MFGFRNPFKKKGKNKRRKRELTTWELFTIGELALASINSENEKFPKEKVN